MHISRSTTINAPIDVVWAKLFDDFVNVHHWMASIKGSSAMPGRLTVEGAPAVGRIAEIGAGAPGALMEEKITAAQVSAYRFEFDTALTNMTGFNPIIGWPNQIKLEAVDGGTQVTWALQPKLKLLGKPMYFAIKKSLGNGFVRSLDEIKAYIETGQPHPRKAAAFEKEGMPADLASAAV